jgi:hypothetical protein
MRNVGSFLVVGLSSVLSAGGAQASPIDGRVRLGLDSTLLSHESFTLTAPAGAEASGSSTRVGLGAGGLGAGVGVGIGNGFLLGGRVLFAHESTDGDGAASVSTDSFSLLAEPEWVLPGSDVRPFLGALVGYRSTSTDAGSLSGSSSLTLIGPEMGLHWFATDSFSLDPRAAFAFETGGQSAGSVDIDRSGFALLLSLGVSGWLGEQPAEPRVADAAARSSLPLAPARDANLPAATTDERPEPERTPSPVLRATVPLGNGDWMTFKMRSPDVDRVSLRIVVHDEADALLSCSELGIRGLERDGTLGPFKAKAGHDGVSRVIVLRTSAPVEVVRALARPKESVLLEGCDRVWELPEASRRDLAAMAEAAGSAPTGARAARE